jgi:hypothetical protein
MHTCFTTISSPESKFRPIYTRPYAPAHPIPVSNHVSTKDQHSEPGLRLCYMLQSFPNFIMAGSFTRALRKKKKCQLAKFEIHSPDGDPTLTQSRRMTFSSKAINRDEDSRKHLTNTITPCNHTGEGLRTSSSTTAQSDPATIQPPPGLGCQLSKCLLRLATKLLGSSRTAKFTRQPTYKRQSTDYRFEVKCITAMQSSEAHFPHTSNTSLHHTQQCKREMELIRRVYS